MKKNMQLSWVSYLQSFTPTIFLLFFLLTLSQRALAQFTDDFSDGDFTNEPTWSGDDSHFGISMDQLHLQAPAENGAAYLSTVSGVTEDAIWIFTVIMQFNPSGSNYARIYLVSDQSNLSASLNGYFVLAGGANKEISLYRQTGTVLSKIIDGRDGALDLSSVTAKIKVTRNQTGDYELFSDVQKQDDYVSEGTVHESAMTDARYFGVRCTYTSSRADKFYFDDFSVTGKIQEDNDPPTLSATEILNSTKLKLTFSEPLDPTIAVLIENYSVNKEIGSPISVTLSDNNKIVELLFASTFPANIPLTLTITGIADNQGNRTSTSKDFIFYIPVSAGQKDVVITEIFADPSPTVGLPELEFVEIHNRSENTFNLAGWKFMDPSSVAILPDFILLPHEYLILISKGADYSFFSKVLPLANFPSLNNKSDILILKEGNGMTMDSVNYSDEWYKDEDKKNGGWSLELIDPDNICSEQENWIASESAKGGTPCYQNSVYANKPDLTGPKLLSAIPLDSKTISLLFNEKLERQLILPTDIKITPHLDLSHLIFSGPALTNIQLSLDDPIQAATTYTIEVVRIYDCAGNPIQEEFRIAAFGLAEKADSLDLLVNEILFNPRPIGVDFVEVVNNSNKFINLKNWSVANFDNGIPKNLKPIVKDNFLLKPGGYLVLTTNANVLKGEYLNAHEQNFLPVESLPSFNDDEGSVLLTDSSKNPIDYFTYTKQMHSVFIKDEEGVSLERISLNSSASSAQNWKSASSTSGFATPGYLNSNATSEAVSTSGPINVVPEIFNPMSGQPSFTQIHYNFDKGGYVGNIKIFDPHGHPIKQIANNEVLGANGFYRWDGDRDDGSKVRMGYYMIWFEIFDEKGITKVFQKRVAVAATF